MLRLLTLIFITAQFAVGAVVDKDVTPEDFAVISGRQYFFSNETLAQTQARAYCRSMNMELLALETQQEHDDVTNYIQTVLNAGTTTFGTSGVRSYDRFVWSSTGTIFSYANWAPNEPGDMSPILQSCVNYRDGLLYDYPNCAYSALVVVCEQLNC